MTSTENIEKLLVPTFDEPVRKGLVDFHEEVGRRMRLATRCAEKVTAREYELERCRRSVEHWANNWLWTFDPRVEPANLPFKLFVFQEETLAWIEARYKAKENGLVEKSRDMGASWVFLGWFLHSWLFREGFFGRLGSRKEELVDDGTEESLFGKLRYMYYRLPRWMRPSGFTKRRDDTYLYLGNPINGSKIVGESTNDDFGRGGRSSATLIDESASIPHSEKVVASISQNSNCVWHLSSPKGKNNAFHRLRHKTTIPVLTLHWSRDPRKDDAWYERQKEEMLPWAVGQELDLSYDVETGEKIYSRFSRQWHVAKEVILPNPSFEQWRSWDFGHGMMALLWGQITPENKIQIYQTYELSGYDIEFFLPIANGRIPSEYNLLTKEERRVLQGTLAKLLKVTPDLLRDYGDHAGTARTANSKRSCSEQMADAKPPIDLITSGKQTYDWRFKCLDRLLRLRPLNAERNKWASKLEVSPDCTRFIDCMNNYINSPAAINRGEVAPVINWASHQVTALEFFAINRFPVEGKTPGYREVRYR